MHTLFTRWPRSTDSPWSWCLSYYPVAQGHWALSRSSKATHHCTLHLTVIHANCNNAYEVKPWLGIWPHSRKLRSIDCALHRQSFESPETPKPKPANHILDKANTCPLYYAAFAASGTLSHSCHCHPSATWLQNTPPQKLFIETYNLEFIASSSKTDLSPAFSPLCI